MLSSILKEHTAKQQKRKEVIERKRNDASVSSNRFAIALVDHLNKQVANAYVNEKKLDTETKILHSNVIQFSRQSEQWIRLVNEFNTAVKEMGDVENWAGSMQADMITISSALECAYKNAD